MNKLIKLIDELESNFNNEVFLHVKHELTNIKPDNLIDEVSYHYYSSYNNILNSENCTEFLINDENTRLNNLNNFYLNRLNKNNEI